MIAFANKNSNLTVVLGKVVYELPTKSADQAASIAARSYDDDVVIALINLACKASPRIGELTELAARDDPRLRVRNV